MSYTDIMRLNAAGSAANAERSKFALKARSLLVVVDFEISLCTVTV